MQSMFEGAIIFDQDLSSWNVAAVTTCGSFSASATAWVASKPNFTICVP